MTENFNQDELEAPEWMNKQFFEKVLKNCENTDTIMVKDVTISPATAKGDHYASVMFRCKITYDSKEGKGLKKSCIIKAMPQVEGQKMDMLKESYIFETEINMYAKMIPKMEAELRKIGDQTILGAKVLFHSLTPQKCIIFEDIVPLGYEVLKERAANLTDSKVAFLKLAKWHAVSYKLAAEGDKSVKEYEHDLFSIKDFDKSPFVANGITDFTNKCETDDELKQYVPKLRAIESDLLDRCRESFSTYRRGNSDGVFVLCHGDFHSRNMMFKKNKEGKTEDVILVDFQICYYGPAILDVLYGFYMLVNKDVRTNHHDELIYYYCSNFIDTLKKCNFQGKIPKISDFYIDILRHTRWEIFLMSTFLPMWYILEETLIDFEELMTSDELRSKIYKNQPYINEVKRLLPSMLHRGYLD